MALWSVGKGVGLGIWGFVLPLITGVTLGEPLNPSQLQFHHPSNGTSPLRPIYPTIGLRVIANIRNVTTLRTFFKKSQCERKEALL